MDHYPASMPFWDLSQPPTAISQLPEDDFLALLQKQFPTDPATSFNLSFPGFNLSTGIDPQSLTTFPFSVPNPTPPSSDSSSTESPPSAETEPGSSRRQSTSLDDSPLKRKVLAEEDDDEDDDDDMDVEPTKKSAHSSSNTTTSASTRKASSRRKSGNPTQDEVRLLKRKEQNRAAQRAFRERKEKHVKDLEDKVASLEARNQRTESENENLRDLLARLQEENMQLKHQSSFPFSVPKEQKPKFTSGTTTASPTSFTTSSPESAKASVASPQSQFLTPNNSEFSFGSLIPFDPAVLNALDDASTSGTDAMNLDFGFGNQKQPFNILASDPSYMSFAENSTPSSASSSLNSLNAFDFSSLDQWSRSDSHSNVQSGPTMQTLDELFGGNNSFLGPTSGIDFATLLKHSPPAPTVSPVIHSNSPEVPARHSECPKTKSDLSHAIEREGLSAFAPVTASPPALQCDNKSPNCEPATHSSFKKPHSQKDPPSVMCRGSSFPKTEQNEKNIEVLSAWRSITSNPQFKDVDINELCSEFTDKARCDGTKVVLEPEGVHSIMESLNTKYKVQQANRV